MASAYLRVLVQLLREQAGEGDKGESWKGEDAGKRGQ